MKRALNIPDTGIICDFGGKLSGNEDAASVFYFFQTIADPDPNYKSFDIPGLIALVADGVSSSNKGELAASFVLHETLQKILNYILSKSFNIKNFRENTLKILKDVNISLRKSFSEYVIKEMTPMCTLAGIVLIGQWLISLNVGDSSVLLSKDDEIAILSHSQKGNLLEHEITQAFGMNEITPIVDISNWAFESDETSSKQAFIKNYYALICSDGITDVISQEELLKHLKNRDNKQLQVLCQEIYEEALKKGTKDNCSLIISDLAEYFKQISVFQFKRLNQIYNSD